MAGLGEPIPFHFGYALPEWFAHFVRGVIVTAVDQECGDVDLVEIWADVKGFEGAGDVELGGAVPERGSLCQYQVGVRNG